MLGAAAGRTDLAEPEETIKGAMFHVGALTGFAVSISKNVVLKTGPAVSFEIGSMSNGGDIKARNILAGFSLSFSFYIPTKKSFMEAAKRSPHRG